MAGPGGAALGRAARVDARDAVDQPVGAGKIETRVEPEREELQAGAHGGARDHAEDAGGGVVADRVVEPGHDDGLGQVLAFGPELELAGFVPGVGPDLEGGHHHDLGAKRLRRRGHFQGGDEKRDEEKEAKGR